MDYLDINRLMTKDVTPPKYKYKRWVKIQDSSNGNYNEAVKYNCKTIADKLVDYKEGFIYLTGIIKASDAANNLANVDHISFKNGSNSIIETATVRLNNTEIDKNHRVYLTTTYLNLLEYSNDYLENAKQYAFDEEDEAIQTAGKSARRKAIAKIGFNNHQFQIELKIPLVYLSTFFRRLNCPIMNNVLELEIELRLRNCLLRGMATGAGGNAVPAVRVSEVVVENTELYLPIVELPSEDEKKFFGMISASYVKEITWDRLNVNVLDTEIDGPFDRQITPSLPGVKKMYVMAVPVANWNNQTHSDTTSNINIRDINITIDSEDFYAQNIKTNHEAYNMLQECFNMGGTNYNSGSLISFPEFKNIYRLYAFDLSRQKIFEIDPRKSQAIRLRGDTSGMCRLIVVLAQERITKINMTDPSKTLTV
jgi:hypothetical protein